MKWLKQQGLRFVEDVLDLFKTTPKSDVTSPAQPAAAAAQTKVVDLDSDTITEEMICRLANVTRTSVNEICEFMRAHNIKTRQQAIANHNVPEKFKAALQLMN